MSNHRQHMKQKAKGGRVVYAGANSNVAKEAAEKKSGGSVHVGKVAGAKGKRRIHKKSGGSVGADRHPFSSAYSAKSEAT